MNIRICSQMYFHILMIIGALKQCFPQVRQIVHIYFEEYKRPFWAKSVLVQQACQSR